MIVLVKLGGHPADEDRMNEMNEGNRPPERPARPQPAPGAERPVPPQPGPGGERAARPQPAPGGERPARPATPRPPSDQPAAPKPAAAGSLSPRTALAGLLVLLVLFLLFRGGDEGEETELEEPAAVEAESIDDLPDVVEAFEDAVDATVRAGSYQMVGLLHLETLTGTVDVALSGWVDGDDIRLFVSNTDTVVETAVIGGVATVTVGGQSTQVAVEEAVKAPVIAHLRNLELESGSEGVVIGTIDQSRLSDLGAPRSDLAGDATVTIVFDDVIRSYEMVGEHGTWNIVMRLANIGGDFAPEAAAP